jgi:hypothetical protein
MNSNLTQAPRSMGSPQFPGWTSVKLIQLSQALTEAYGLGVTPSSASTPDQGWTTEKLLQMSAAKSL